MEPGQEQAAGLLVGSPPQDLPPCSCAGRQRERLLHQSAAKAGGRGQHGMRPGGSSSTLLGCHLPLLPPESLLLQQQMQPRIHCKKDNGQGAVQPKRLEPGVANHCCPQISRMDKSESDEGGLSANPAQIMSSSLRIGPITAAMGLIHGLMTKVGSN